VAGRGERAARERLGDLQVALDLAASATGTCASGPKLEIRFSISASAGGITWAPSLR